MKKKIFIFLLVFLVLAGAYSWYYISQKNKNENVVVDNTLVYEDLLFYNSSYMNFLLKYPRNYEVYEKAIGGNAQTNCIVVSSVENPNSSVTIAYEPLKIGKESCFKVDLNSDESIASEKKYKIGDNEIEGTQTPFDKDGVTYLNTLYKVENAKLNKKTDEFFAIQMQYPENEESKYLKELEIIVNNFVWK